MSRWDRKARRKLPRLPIDPIQVEGQRMLDEAVSVKNELEREAARLGFYVAFVPEDDFVEVQLIPATDKARDACRSAWLADKEDPLDQEPPDDLKIGHRVSQALNPNVPLRELVKHSGDKVLEHARDVMA